LVIRHTNLTKRAVRPATFKRAERTRETGRRRERDGSCRVVCVSQKTEAGKNQTGRKRGGRWSGVMPELAYERRETSSIRRDLASRALLDEQEQSDSNSTRKRKGMKEGV